MSKKLPAMQFYTGDWLKDTRLLSPAAKGAWIDILVAMWDAKERGKMTATPQEYARLIGADTDHFMSIVEELKKHEICDFRHEDHHGEEKITMISRRMVREERIRQKKADAGRKGGLRSRPGTKDEPEEKEGESKDGSKGKAKRGSSTSSSTSSSSNKPYTGEFEEFWELYGIKKGKKKAWLEWKKLTEADKEAIMENVPVFLTHFSDPDWTPRPRKYLYNRYWEDEGYQEPQKRKSNGSDNQTGGSRTDQFFDRGEELLDELPE